MRCMVDSLSFAAVAKIAILVIHLWAETDHVIS